MNGSNQGTGHPGTGQRGFDPWQAVEELRDALRQRVGSRRGRGDVRAALLALLAEQPMHGYELIREIEARSEGAWRPSPGSVYPTLQLLADEGAVTVAESNGKKVYALTDTGREEADAAADPSAPWASSEAHDARAALPKAGLRLAQAVAQVGRDGTTEQLRDAAVVLEDARRTIYAILAGE